jgi:hypothetical protein
MLPAAGDVQRCGSAAGGARAVTATTHVPPLSVTTSSLPVHHLRPLHAHRDLTQCGKCTTSSRDFRAFGTDRISSLYRIREVTWRRSGRRSSRPPGSVAMN